ncbi:MAG: hypothetical protein ACU0CO_01325 [Shimia sp.]
MSDEAELIQRARDAANRLGRFDIRELAREAKLATPGASFALRRLAETGDVERLPGSSRGGRWAITDMSRLVSLQAAAAQTVEGHIWTVICILRTFTVDDVVASLASTQKPVSRKVAQKYCTALAEAKIIAVQRKAARGRPAFYSVRQRTGPLPPVIRRVPLLYDPNTGTYHGVEALGT